ncbi:hypothetical protein DBR40_24855 [Pedobacter sp. KBW01]|nr:hypothetical protein DBR40_24855 [Pedobacter sp. KBW01]
MINGYFITTLLQEYRENQSIICWLRCSVGNASGRGKLYLAAELIGTIEAQKSLRNMMDKCYIEGITTEQLLKDIQR